MNDKYIYNIKQANYFIENGANCIGLDIHRSTNKVFAKFTDGEKFQNIYDKWLELCNKQ